MLDALARMPAIGKEIAEGVKPAVGAHALSLVLGIERTLVHRMLEAIDDERILQRISLRLAQARLPRCAQVRHGPLEYGKDVVVLTEESGRRILRMYQLKVGDLDRPDWRAVQPQLEEMFLVPLKTINIDPPADEQIGVLVCNGHAGPSVDLVMG